MIGVEKVEKALAIIGASQSVKNGSGPVSANIIAPSDSGKSQLMLKALPAGARVLNDITTMTLNAMMQEKTPPTYIVVPDFNVVISHKPAVAELTMALLLALMGEGVTELHPGLQNEVRIMMTRARKTGLRIALITGMTPEMFNGKRGKWRSTGLIRRMVPIHFAYTVRTQRLIQTSIEKGGDSLEYNHTKQKKFKARSVDIPMNIRRQLRELSEVVVDQLCWRAGDARDGRQHILKGVKYPFTPHKILRQLARAAAILNDHGTVTADDFNDTEMVAEFMRYDHPTEV